ncbi:tetratricopeptide repeat protein [Methylopila musalis]|uniref:Tetratricopeptide repeat protein n=1 Tax=Methylopila musalis TaxID=1134781 RepID=A0ABW3Z9S6_9HYPH
MMRLAPGVALAAVLFSAAPAGAQPAPPPDRGPEGLTPILPGPAPKASPPETTGPIPAPEAHGKAADELLKRLAEAKDPAVARRIAGAVQALWARSGSDTADLLVSRAGEAQRKARLPMAITLMDQVIALKPDYADGWSRRAALRYQSRDYDRAMLDLHETLSREPRQFMAWLTLGRILKDNGLNKPALGAFRKALALYPTIEGLDKEVDELALEVEGRPI